MQPSDDDDGDDDDDLFESDFGAPEIPDKYAPGKIIKLGTRTFTVGKRLGYGDHGQVFLVTEKDPPNQRYALKVTDFATESVHEDEYFLSHTFSLDGMSYRDGQDHLFLTPSFGSGRDLNHFLCEKGTLTLEETQALCVELIDTVVHLHASGYCHGDLRTPNVFVQCEEKSGAIENLYLIDFGSTSKVQAAEHYAFVPYLHYLESKDVSKSDQYFTPNNVFFPKEAEKALVLSMPTDIYMLGGIFLAIFEKFKIGLRKKKKQAFLKASLHTLVDFITEKMRASEPMTRPNIKICRQVFVDFFRLAEGILSPAPKGPGEEEKTVLQTSPSQSDRTVQPEKKTTTQTQEPPKVADMSAVLSDVAEMKINDKLQSTVFKHKHCFSQHSFQKLCTLLETEYDNDTQDNIDWAISSLAEKAPHLLKHVEIIEELFPVVCRDTLLAMLDSTQYRSTSIAPTLFFHHGTVPDRPLSERDAATFISAYTFLKTMRARDINVVNRVDLYFPQMLYRKGAIPLLELFYQDGNENTYAHILAEMKTNWHKTTDILDCFHILQETKLCEAGTPLYDSCFSQETVGTQRAERLRGVITLFHQSNIAPEKVVNFFQELPACSDVVLHVLLFLLKADILDHNLAELFTQKKIGQNLAEVIYRLSAVLELYPDDVFLLSSLPEKTISNLNHSINELEKTQNLTIKTAQALMNGLNLRNKQTPGFS